MAMSPQKKAGEAERMRRFLDYCEAVGIRDQDMIELKSYSIAGEGNIHFSLESLRHLLSMEK